MSESDPVLPAEPAFAVRMLNAPLEAARPNPVITEMAPPVTFVLSPAFIAIRPPALDFPLPTITLMLPPTPSVADPLRKEMFPLLPFEVVPEVKDREPDTPSDPESDDLTLNTPLEAARP